jgi:hypothetical protein
LWIIVVPVVLYRHDRIYMERERERERAADEDRKV